MIYVVNGYKDINYSKRIYAQTPKIHHGTNRVSIPLSALKGRGHVFQHLKHVSNTYFHEISSGSKKSCITFDIQLILNVSTS